MILAVARSARRVQEFDEKFNLLIFFVRFVAFAEKKPSLRSAWKQVNEITYCPQYFNITQQKLPRNEENDGSFQTHVQWYKPWVVESLQVNKAYNNNKYSQNSYMTTFLSHIYSRAFFFVVIKCKIKGYISHLSSSIDKNSLNCFGGEISLTPEEILN